MLAFLLAHRFHSAARVESPATFVTNNTYNRGTSCGQLRLTPQVSFVPALCDPICCAHAQITSQSLCSNKTRTKTHPVIAKFKTRSSQSQNSKPPSNFPKQNILLLDSWCSGPSTIPAFPNSIFSSNRDKLFSVPGADILRLRSVNWYPKNSFSPCQATIEPPPSIART